MKKLIVPGKELTVDEAIDLLKDNNGPVENVFYRKRSSEDWRGLRVVTFRSKY